MAHTIPKYLRHLEANPGSVQNQPAPPHPGTKHLVKGIKEGDCYSPDQIIANMMAQRSYEIEHHEPRAAVIDPARPAALLSGTSATIENVDDIFRFGSVHEYFGRTGCDGQSCEGHFNFRCDIHVPYPPYQICSGDYEMKQIRFTAYVTFIGSDASQTLAMAETINRLIKIWATP